ncbi:hypothetical protein HZU83_17950 [Sphaerotilus montanus]|uniref:Uncharacterized protein n=2 Tax=Sphaerotilus montanus TaxID=522889 RepID=A0A7Y9QY53_9BURK|nr:hypothetical protein [Sphaerotilus montanus]NYG31928.1 hypothetical protein [Sphaerotilus montanus]NZD58570.1 hypothetical protein [Sphaerotilus montanus]
MDIKPVLVVERVDEQTGEKVWQEARPSAYLEIPEADRLRLNLFRLIDGAYTPEEIGRIHSLPRFEITAFAQDIPKELLGLPPCSEVVLRSSSSDDVITVENAIQKFRRIISPPDRLTVFEAVGLLERYGIQPPPTGKTHGPFRIDPLQWLCREVEAGRLVFNDHGGLRIEPGEYAGHFGLYGETTSRKELNAWLERIGHLHRIPEPVAPSVAVDASTPAPSASAPAVAVPERVAAPVADPDETTQERQDRRLRELRADGAEFIVTDREKRHGQVRGGRRGALARLTAREQAAGRPMSTKDGVRQDLVSAVMREVGRNGRLSR